MLALRGTIVAHWATCFTSEQSKRYNLWSCQKVCDALHYLLDTIFREFGSISYIYIYSQYPNVHLERNFVRELYTGERLVKKIRDGVEHPFIAYCVKVWIINFM